ncbi:MAG: hypothetical protein RL621_1388 [Bacteroidota bacterium]
MKKCIKCLRELDESCFSKSSGANFLRPECRECNNRLAKERKQLREKHGYPKDGYVCPICLRTEEQASGSGGRASTWVVDHDHNKNTFRGFLCHSCNRALGLLKDDRKNLKRAIKYLKSN